MFTTEFEKTAVSAKKYKEILHSTAKRIGPYDTSDKVVRHAIRSEARGTKLTGEAALKNQIHFGMRKSLWQEAGQEIQAARKGKAS